MRIWLGKGQLPDGRKHYNLGLEVRKVIEAVEGSLAEHFPNAGITESKAVRELLEKC